MDEKTKAKMQVGFTIVLGVFCIVQLSIQPDESIMQKWSFGIIGLLVGYWLK